MNDLVVTSKLGDYRVSFEPDFSFLGSLAALENRVVVVDRNVLRLYADALQVFGSSEIIAFDALEDRKNLESVMSLYDALMSRQAKKNLTLVSIGGGITQDVTGFAASTLYRGIPWIFVPTTLLAQADSCIGSKTSLNFRSYKNLVGTFYPPRRVHIHTGFVRTLTENDYFSGLGEVLKLQIMKDGPLDLAAASATIAEARARDDRMLELIRDCLDVKISYLKDDEFDRGRRNLLNYGHCFGHALETASSYRIPHGVAVVVGMMFANLLSVRRGWLGASLCAKIDETLLLPNLPKVVERSDLAIERLLSGMRNDKKRIGRDLTVILPDSDLNLKKADDVRDDEVAGALEALSRRLSLA